MLGRLIVALLIIAAAAVVTMEKETAEVADMTATLAESKYDDAARRADLLEQKLRDAEAKITELDGKSRWLEGELAEQKRLRELALLPLEVRTTATSTGAMAYDVLQKVVTARTPAMNACFARAEDRGPTLEASLVVDAGGMARNVRVAHVPEGFAAVAKCLERELATWRFPPQPQQLALVELRFATATPEAAPDAKAPQAR